MIIQNITSPAAQGSQPAGVAQTTKVDPVHDNADAFVAITTVPVSQDALSNAVSVINQVMRQSNSSLQFSVDTDTNTAIVRLVDTTTGELIRQIPSEETLAISRSINESLQRQGLLCKQVA